MVRRMFGSIEKKGRRYRVRYQSEGRWVTAPVTFTTKAAVKAWLANQAHGHRSRRQGRPQPRQRTPRPLGPQLARNRSDLEETTRANYEGLLRLRACPRSTTAGSQKSTGSDAHRSLRDIMNTALATTEPTRTLGHRGSRRSRQGQLCNTKPCNQVRGVGDRLQPLHVQPAALVGADRTVGRHVRNKVPTCW